MKIIRSKKKEVFEIKGSDGRNRFIAEPYLDSTAFIGLAIYDDEQGKMYYNILTKSECIRLSEYLLKMSKELDEDPPF